jgi:cytochrome c oxidase cbb3-type subunit III
MARWSRRWRLSHSVVVGVVAMGAAGVGWALQASAPAAASSAPSLIAHPDHIQPGLPTQRPQLTLVNPREHDPRAVEEGKQLFIAYNCADCHGSEGSGDTGPSLQDGRWHFGGTAGDVYESIEEGRPDGMPSWGGRIPESQVWALVTYVRTLSDGKDVSTENFEGATIQRGGH